MISRFQRSDWVVLVCLITVACVFTGWLLSGVTDSSATILVALAMSALMLTAAVVRYFRAGRDLMDPLIVVSASLVFYFGAHTLWLATHTEQAQMSYLFPFTPGLTPSLALLGIGYIMLLFGFLALREKSQKSNDVRRSWYSCRSLIFVFVIGMAGNLAAAASGGYTKASNVGQLASNILIYKTLGFTAIIAFVVCACQHYTLHQRRTAYQWTMWVMFAVLVLFALSVAEKRIAFSMIFAWVASRNYTRAHVRPSQLLIVLVVALFVITPIIQSARGTEALHTVGNQATISSVQTTGTTVPQRLATYLTNFPTSALSGFNIINRRTNGSESLALAYLYTPSHQDFRYGQHWIDILTSLIPHFVWPNKPVHNDTQQFSEIYAGKSQASGNGLTVAPTLPGDFYMNFGWVGILGGMFIFGMLIKFVSNAVRSASSSVAVPIYVSTMLALVLVEQTTADIGSTMLLQLLATALAFGLLRLSVDPRIFLRRSRISVATGDGRKYKPSYPELS